MPETLFKYYYLVSEILLSLSSETCTKIPFEEKWCTKFTHLSRYLAQYFQNIYITAKWTNELYYILMDAYTKHPMGAKDRY